MIRSTTKFYGIFYFLSKWLKSNVMNHRRLIEMEEEMEANVEKAKILRMMSGARWTGLITKPNTLKDIT